MVASRFRAAALCPDSSPAAPAGPADAASLSDCTPLFIGGDHQVPVVVADLEPPCAADAGEPLDDAAESVCALGAAGTTEPRKLAACASFVLHVTIAGFFVTMPNEVRIAGGRTTEMAAIDVVLAPAPAVETAVPEENSATDPEPVEEPPPAEPAPGPDPVETINKAMQLQESLPEFPPPGPVKIPPPPETVETPVPDAAPVGDSRPDLLAASEEPDSTEQADAVPQPVEKTEEVARPESDAGSGPKPDQPPEPEPAAPEEVQPESAPEIDGVPELANVPVPQSKPDYRLLKRTERAEAKPQPPRKADNRPEKPRKRDVKEAQLPSRQAASGVGQRRSEAGNARVSNYPGRVVTKLRRALRYPSAGRRDRLRGEVHVRFTVLASGAISNVSVTGSSGSPILDKAAIETVRRAAPFPDIPPAAGRPFWAFTVPLAFRP